MCDLQIERPKRSKEFTITWSIRNYSYCSLKEGDYLVSPQFEVDIFREAHKWHLSLYPRGRNSPGYLSCYLQSRGQEKPTPFKYTLSIRNSDGQFKEGREKIYKVLDHCGEYNFVHLEELKSPGGYLTNDTLTVRCRMWKTTVGVPPSVNLDVHSQIKVSKLDYKWILKESTATNANNFKIDDFKDISCYFASTVCSFKMRVFNEEVSGKSALHFRIEMAPQIKNVICVVHFLDGNGREVYTVSGQQLFRDSPSAQSFHRHVFTLPLISKEKFYANKTLYTSNGELTLRCQVGFSSDNELQTSVYETTNVVDPQNVTIDDNIDEQDWMKNMQQRYEGGKFSDFVIRTPGRQFPVHKMILGAHSEVFEAMFESDMKESKSGVVHIEDLDDDTISKMLMYIYTNTFDDINYSSAQKLYVAADKYEITSLRKRCSSYLKQCLDDSNVCEVLVFADTLRDQDLKSCAKDFVHARAQQVLYTESWKKLTETNPLLTSEVMQWIICNKYLI